MAQAYTGKMGTYNIMSPHEKNKAGFSALKHPEQALDKLLAQAKVDRGAGLADDKRLRRKGRDWTRSPRISSPPDQQPCSSIPGITNKLRP